MNTDLNTAVTDRKNIQTGVITGLVSGAFFVLGIGYLLYLVPLQFAVSKRGAKSFFIALAVSLVVSIAGVFIRQSGPDVWVSFAAAAGYVLAIVALNYPALLSGPGIAMWQRLAAAIILSATGMILAVLVLRDRRAWTELLTFIEETPQLSELLLTMLPGYNLEAILDLVRSILYRTIVVSSGVMVLVSYIVGRAFARGVKELRVLAERFELPVNFIWVLIFMALLLLMGEKFSLLPLAYIGWNGFLTALLLYIFKGIAVLWKLVKNRPLIRASLPIIIIISFVIPGMNLALPVIFAVLGISSIWIRYSSGTDSNGSAGSRD